MNENRPGTSWPLMLDRVKKRWSRLTDEELDAAHGSLEQLRAVIQEKYGESRQAIDIQLRHLLEPEGHTN